VLAVAVDANAATAAAPALTAPLIPGLLWSDQLMTWSNWIIILTLQILRGMNQILVTRCQALRDRRRE
jgi:hypothetical protein